MAYRPIPDEAIEDGDALHVLHPWAWSDAADDLLDARGPCVSHTLRRSGVHVDVPGVGGGATSTNEVVLPELSSPLGGSNRLCWPMLVWQSGPHTTLQVDAHLSGTGEVSLWCAGRESDPVAIGSGVTRVSVRLGRRIGWHVAALVFRTPIVEDIELGMTMTVLDPYRLQRGGGAARTKQHTLVTVGDVPHLCGSHTGGIPADATLEIWPPTELTGSVQVSAVVTSTIEVEGVEIRLIGESNVAGPRIGTPARARTPADASRVHSERYVQSVDLVSAMTCQPVRITTESGVESWIAQATVGQERVSRCDGDGALDRAGHEFAVLAHSLKPEVSTLRAGVRIGSDVDVQERNIQPPVLGAGTHTRSARERGWGNATWGGLDLPTVGEVSQLQVATVYVPTDEIAGPGVAWCRVELVDGSDNEIADARFLALGIAVRRS